MKCKNPNECAWLVISLSLIYLFCFVIHHLYTLIKKHYFLLIIAMENDKFPPHKVHTWKEKRDREKEKEEWWEIEMKIR